MTHAIIKKVTQQYMELLKYPNPHPTATATAGKCWLSLNEWVK